MTQPTRFEQIACQGTAYHNKYSTNTTAGLPSTTTPALRTIPSTTSSGTDPNPEWLSAIGTKGFQNLQHETAGILLRSNATSGALAKPNEVNSGPFERSGKVSGKSFFASLRFPTRA
jgi:hypothetical protein